MFRKLFSVLVVSMLVVLVVFPGLTIAQNEEWTCGDGPNDVLNAAQAAFDSGDTETAWALATRAEALCAAKPDRFEEAHALRMRHIERNEGYDPLFEATENPENLFDLGDYKLFMHCMGDGSPTVIFEHGSGVGAEIWNEVLPAVSTVTRACTYSRYGLEPSDKPPSDMVRTTRDQVDDLMALLEIGEIEPPYVLVGHSSAGYNVLVFTDQYPDLVEGIVLVDAVHPDGEARCLEALDNCQVATTDPVGPEHLDFATSMTQAGVVENFGSRPLVVLTGSVNTFFGDFYPIWVELHEEYATYSTNSQHVIAEGIGHMINVDAPELVIEAILWVLDELEAAEEIE